jgi:hypothetical protein
MKKVLFAAVLCLLALPFAVRADDIIVAEGDTLPKVAVGDVVRITQSGAAGRTEISAEVTGDAKLNKTNSIRVFKNGRPLIGAVTKEFEVKATKKGTAKITVTIKDTVANTEMKKEYTLEIE